MTAKTVDFDAFRAERAKEPVHLVIGGQTYDLPSSLPAAIAVDLIHLRASLAEDADVPIETLDVFGKSIFGPALWREILEVHRIQVDELADLIQLVLAAYQPDKTEDPPTAST